MKKEIKNNKKWEDTFRKEMEITLKKYAPVKEEIKEIKEIEKIPLSKKIKIIKKPECENYWTSVYYGARGSGKTLHQAKEVLKILKYLETLYSKYPSLQRAIVISNQKFSKELENKYLNNYLYYWEDAEDFRFCPRKICWRGKTKHKLHGAYLIFDDLATILPASSWSLTPLWLRKTFLQARHNGIRCLANLQDPFSCDINFRRCIDVAYKFTKIIGTKDPDETKKPIGWIFGIYRRRKIDSETLWRYGDLPEQTIRMMLAQKESDNEQMKEMGKEMEIVYDDSWRGSYHYFTKKHCLIYDTNQDVKEFKPQGFLHEEYKCIDPRHKDCKHTKVIHELI